MNLNVGILTSTASIGSAYQTWAEETLSYLPNVDEVNVELVNARSSKLRTDIDVLILVGGSDVYPARYGAKPHSRCQKPNIDLEWFDTEMLPQYIKLAQQNKLAIIGICRGHQTLNVHFGGVLTQDFPYNYSGDQRGKLVDKLTLISPDLKNKTNNNIFDWAKQIQTYRKETSLIEVNSLHHQGFNQYQLATCFEMVAIETNHRNVEIMAHKEFPIIGFQFHPEELGLSRVISFMLQHVLSFINNGKD